MNIEIKELLQLITENHPPCGGFDIKAQPRVKSRRVHPSGQHIVVLDRGFVYVGDITVDDYYCRISNAKNIRFWGTVNGLGELRNGPLEKTKLDEVGSVIAPAKSVIHYIPCKGF